MTLTLTRYETQLENFCKLMDPLLDLSPPEKLHECTSFNSRMKDNLQKSVFWANLLQRAVSMGQKELLDFMDLLLSTASKVLNNWFEADVLKATLGTDAVIGATGTVNTPGSGYVLLHHVMGETNGDRNVWSYVEGGMGSVSSAISSAAREAGATIVTEAEVSKLIIEDSGKVSGVLLADGKEVHSSVVLSNATPYRTFMEFVPQNVLPDDFLGAIKNSDYSSATTKINMAVDQLPQFHCCKLNSPDAGPQHMGTIHIGTERMEEIESACLDSVNGIPSRRPIIEMTIPSALDKTISPPGKHVVNLFVQYTPYKPSDGSWEDPEYRVSGFSGLHQNTELLLLPHTLLPQPNGPQAVGPPNQTTGIAPSLYAPPSSPASFSHSALPSTAQSPNCFLSANSPGGPSSTMYVTGPYAHETQLVSPPVFSTFTTEPSTAPLTPPPELAHLTTPSSPDVPYAHFLSSSSKMKSTDKNGYCAANDLHATYLLYPGSPASTLRSPVSRTPEKEFPSQWSPIPSQEPAYSKSGSGRFIGLEAGGNSKSRQDSNFFCPETFAQFYLDQSSLSNSGGRLSISRESDAYTNGNVHQNRQTKVSKPDPEELEAYRASFGFSADEIVTTTHYVEISNVSDDSFSITPPTPKKSAREENILNAPSREGIETGKRQEDRSQGNHSGVHDYYDKLEDQVQQKRISGRTLPTTHILSDDEDIYSKMGAPRNGRKYQFGSSNSDAEIEYRRGRSLREERSWRQS